MCCPYFIPISRTESAGLPHPARLPLRAAFAGSCAAHAGETAQADLCNLGYASACAKLPSDRTADAHRFGVRLDGAQAIVTVIAEAAHRPAGRFELVYDVAERRWLRGEAAPAVLAQAECFLREYLERAARPLG